VPPSWPKGAKTVTACLLAMATTVLVGEATGASSLPERWTRMTVPLPDAAANGQLAAIGCWSPTGCIIGGIRGANAATFTGTTMNGGRSWFFTSRFPAPLAGGVASIACDRSGCFMVGENLAEDADALGFTRNQGRSWSIVPLPQQWISEAITPGFIGCTTSTCLVYGNNIFAMSGKNPSNYRVALVSTSDDGRSWSPAALPGGSGDLDAIACIGAGRCWALYRSAQPQEGVAVSIDGGRTWTTVGVIGNAFDPDHFGGFGCATRTSCYLVDDSNDLFVTHNGGQEWSPTNPPRNRHGSTDLETDGLACASESATCYIVGIAPPTSLWKSQLAS